MQNHDPRRCDVDFDARIQDIAKYVVDPGPEDHFAVEAGQVLRDLEAARDAMAHESYLVLRTRLKSLLLARGLALRMFQEGLSRPQAAGTRDN
jgi:hypothetical protein